jgi:uncharacterized protein YegP (UPF0339 family)
MTRSRRVAHAVSALREARAADSAQSEPAPVTFLVFEDNGGSYRWTILAADGATLARSEGFASYDDAEQAARRLHQAATSAHFQRRANGASPVDLIARRDAASDDVDAERWLDEGGSLSSEAVAR